MSPRPVELAPLLLRYGGWLSAAAGAICFLSSLGNEFTYDDVRLVRDNPRVRHIGDFRGIWLTDWWQPQTEYRGVLDRQRDRLYRPLAMFTLALNYAIGGLAPFGYHALNVALHALACWLAWRVALRLLDDPRVALAAGLLFAVHPIHCEAVANVVGRAEVLAAICLCAGLLALPASPGRAALGRTALASAAFLAALLAKETAVSYIAIALTAMLWLAARRGAAWRWPALLMHTLVLLIPLAIYFPLRYAALEGRLLRDLPPSEMVNPMVLANAGERGMHAFTILGHYVRLLVAPAVLSANYGLAVIDPRRGAEAMTMVGLLAAAAAAVGLIGLFSRRAGWRAAAMLLALSVFSYALISNTLLLIGVSVAERLMYWPSVPVLIFFAFGGVRLWEYADRPGSPLAGVRRVLPIAGLALLAVLGLRTAVRNQDWQDNLTLFAVDAYNWPQSAELNYALGSSLLGEFERDPHNPAAHDWILAADRAFAASLQISPRYTLALRDRGRTLALLGDIPQAIRYVEAQVQLSPLDREARALLAALRGQTPEAESRLAALREAAASQPASAGPRVQLGAALLDLGRYPEALAELREAVRLEPQNVEALRVCGEASAAMGEDAEAVALFESALRLTPRDWRLHLNLTTLRAKSDPAKALEHARAAWELEPDGVETNQNLIEALVLNGLLTEASQLLERAIVGLPPGDPRRAALEMRLREIRHMLP